MSEWAIPQQSRLKFTQLFNLHDRLRSGFLSGIQCRDILLQSGLPKSVLAEIWNLSDIDGDGQLTREEFILAMYLTSEVRAGRELPSELAPELVPPSYRKVRANSTTSIQSASSGLVANSGNLDELNEISQSSGSVLNTGSFENKRRENFEKGRAELEKRRLKIVDQQLLIVKEQLESSKKQVTEAKAKIDAMRIERDNKMGIITTLEAQLQDLKDRKANLLQEEQTLNAIENDLKAKAAISEKRKAQEATKPDKPPVKFDSSTSKTNSNSDYRESKFDDAFDPQDAFLDNKTSNQEDSFNQPDTFYQKDAFSDDPFQQDPFQQDDPFKNEEIFKQDDPFAKDTSAENDVFNKIATIKLEDSNTTVTETITSTIDSHNLSGKKYRAIYAFDARNPDELTIKPGDIIDNLDGNCEPGWLIGDLNGQRGLFPEAYAEPLAEPTADVLNNNSIFGETPNTSDLNDSLLSKSSQSSLIRYKVLFPFEARNSDELTINPDDIITGIEGAYEPGWLMGELNGQKGLFPETYVEKINDESLDKTEPGQLQRMSSVGSLRSKKSRQKRAEVATVIANYEARGEEQLSLEKGQLVAVRRKIDSGWWEGEIQIKGKKKQSGWFPASYVKLLSTNQNAAQQ